jgi:dienelactone hydrolase
MTNVGTRNGKDDSSDDHNPTLRQILHAAIKICADAISVRFRRRKPIKFTSAGQSIRGCFYYPHSEGKAPGVLLLPTAFGLTPHEHAFAARLAREGYTTLVIAYSKRTTGVAVIENEIRRKNLEQIAVHGWRVLQEDPKVDSVNTAVIGLSLGGYFAMYIATTIKELAPKAVAVYYGTYALAGSNLGYLRAPLLILQGENDSQDFVANAKRVQEISSRDDKPWEVVLYSNTGHQFDLFESGGDAARDAWERTIKFLRLHLSS